MIDVIINVLLQYTVILSNLLDLFHSIIPTESFRVNESLYLNAFNLLIRVLVKYLNSQIISLYSFSFIFIPVLERETRMIYGTYRVSS